MSLFGPLMPARVIERAARETIGVWIADYLAEVADQADRPRNSLAVPQSWPTASQFGRAEDALPAVGIHCPGTTGIPSKHADGTYRVTWRLEVGALVAANTQVNTDELAKLYGAAIWGCVMQHRSLGGVAEHTAWVDERYDVIDAAKDRSIAFCLLTFDVEVIEARSSYGGPETPTDPAGSDPGDWPTVQRVDIDVEPLDPT